MSKARITCGYCKGEGTVPLTGVYAETLKTLRRKTKGGAFVVANRDAGLFACEPTALNNRLAWLESKGFAASEQYGRERRYTAL